MSPALRADSLPAEPQGKPKNTGVGRLSLLQQIVPAQESSQGLLHWRWTLHQLSCQGSPRPRLHSALELLWGFSSVALSRVSTGVCWFKSLHQLLSLSILVCFSVLLYGITFAYSWPAAAFLAVLGLSCSMWDLVPWSGVTPGPPALEAWSLSLWTTREIPLCLFLV